METTPASPQPGREGSRPQMPGEMPGFPADSDRDDEVDVLYLAGQQPAGPGEWLLITAVEGPLGADFLARVLTPGGQYARGGDVLVHLAAEPGTGRLEPPAVRVSAWAVLNGLLIPVARCDRRDPDGWPEQVRATAAFTLGHADRTGRPRRRPRGLPPGRPGGRRRHGNGRRPGGRDIEPGLDRRVIPALTPGAAGPAGQAATAACPAAAFPAGRSPTTGARTTAHVPPVDLPWTPGRVEPQASGGSSLARPGEGPGLPGHARGGQFR